MSITITTNHRPRPMLAWSQIPERERPELDFGADPDAEGQYVKAYGRWYMLEHFTVIVVGTKMGPSAAIWVDPASPLAEWGAACMDSMGTGVVLRWTDDTYEHAVIGYVIVKDDGNA